MSDATEWNECEKVEARFRCVALSQHKNKIEWRREMRQNNRSITKGAIIPARRGWIGVTKKVNVRSKKGGLPGDKC